MASEEVLSRFAMEESPSLVNRRYAGPFGGSSCGLVVRRMVEIVVSTGSTSNFRSGNAFPIDIRGTEGDRISNGLRPEAWCERI